MGHHHHEHHHHGHTHHHHHGTENIQVAFWLNISFAVIEIAGGFYTNSLAILSDALHDFGDSLALGLAWYFANLADKERDRDYSYGYGRFSVLGAIINSLILIVGSIFIIKEAIPRILAPEQAMAEGMLVLAILGVIINGVAVWRMKSATSLNEKVMSLHLMEDLLGWVAVLIASVIMIFVDVPILDPILSLLIAAYILYNVTKNLKSSLRVVMQGTPAHIDLEILKKELIALDPAITNVHDFHLWTIDGEFHIASFHLAVNTNVDKEKAEQIKLAARTMLNKTYHIEHATIELHDDITTCELDDEKV